MRSVEVAVAAISVIAFIALMIRSNWLPYSPMGRGTTDEDYRRKYQRETPRATPSGMHPKQPPEITAPPEDLSKTG